MRNHYYTLGLSENASDEEIKTAFKRLAVKYHPDKHMGDVLMEEKFKSVNEAYQILSDPYKKAQFDLQLQYQRFAEAQTQRPVQQPYHYRPPTKRYGGRPYYRPRPINHKENNRATLYAFGITFGIALLVMIVKGAYDFYLEKKFEAYLAERRTTFHEAQQLYEQDDIRNSLYILADMAPFYSEEQDMRKFRTDALQEIMFKGEDYYVQRDFEKAVRYFELAEQFSPYRPMALKAHLAQSYRFVQKPEKSIRMLKELIETNYQVVPTLVQIADIYNKDLRDSLLARDYLELARDVAVNAYRQRFGKAYMMVVKEEHLPAEHYFLYKELALLYNHMDEPENSLGATNWMKRVWTDSAQAWVIAGKSYELMGQPLDACREYGQARNMGFKEPLPLLCK